MSEEEKDKLDYKSYRDAQDLQKMLFEQEQRRTDDKTF